MYRLLWYHQGDPTQLYARTAFLSAAKAFRYAEWLKLKDFIIDLGG